MAVKSYERTRVDSWCFFKGSAPESEKPLTAVTYFCRFLDVDDVGDPLRHPVLLFGNDMPGPQNDPPDEEYSALDIPADLFARCLERVLDGTEKVMEMPGYGQFSMEGKSRVLYVTDCGQNYRFSRAEMESLLKWVKG